MHAHEDHADDASVYAYDERDSESANNYAMFRYHVNRLGRFSSPDPLTGSIAEPQSLNRYAYVLNDPINFIYPLGLVCVWDDGTFDDPPEDGGADQQTCEAEGGTWVNGNIAIVVVVMYPLRPTSVIYNDVGVAPRLGSPLPPESLMSGISSVWQRTRTVNQCAASTANNYSVAAFTGAQNLPIAGSLFSNYFSSLSQLVFGPGRGGGVANLATNAASFGVNPAAKAAGAIPVNSGYRFLFRSIPATTFAETAVGELTLGAVAAGSAGLAYEAVGQFFYDAATYATSLVTCSLR